MLRNVAVSELLRRSFVVATRLLPAALVVLVPAFLPLIASSILFGAMSDVTSILLAVYVPLVSPVLAAALTLPAIRSSLGGRFTAREVFSLAGPGLRFGALAGLAQGAATMFGLGLCLVPGWILGAMLFVATPVAVCERVSISRAFRQSVELTRGHRWKLFAVGFVIAATEGAFSQAAGFFVVLSDPYTAITLLLLIAGFGMLLRAVVSALAYDGLYVAKHELDVDGLVLKLGGKPRDRSLDQALSERDIEALARRRGVVTRLTGQGSEEESVDGVASVSDMQGFAGSRDRKLRVVAGVAVSLVVIGVVTASVIGISGRISENRRLDGYEESARSAHAEALNAVGFDKTLSVTRASRTILSQLVETRPERQREMLGRLLAIHADDLYGPGFGEAFRVYGQDKSGDDLLAALATVLGEYGCTGTPVAARKAENPGRAFSENCPTGQTSPLDKRRFKPGLDLGRAAFAQLLELRARERRVENEPLHEATLKLLLGH
jgi:hypothetical protein